MKQYTLHSAFTLIEMLFIVVIIGMVIALSLATFQMQSLNTRIDKTALQMQQLLQAANTYYAAWGCWPGATNCPKNADDFNYYLPIGNKNNPWGNPYTYAQDPQNAANFLIYSGNVSTNPIASRIASVLPNATIDPNNSQQVIASLQGQTSSVLFQYFVSIPSIATNYSFQVSFECPKNWTGTAVAIPYGIQADPQSCVWNVFLPPNYVTPMSGSNLISDLETGFSCSSNPGKTEDYWTCNGTFYFLSNVQQKSNFCIPQKGLNGGTATIMVIGYCQQP